MDRQRSGNRFTLCEMLVVIAIIAVLAALLMPALQKAVGFARQCQCGNNLKMIAYANMQYAAENNGYGPGIYFRTKIAPYLDLAVVPPFPYSCPDKDFDDSNFEYSNYSVNGRLDNNDNGTDGWNMQIERTPRPSGTYFYFDGRLQKEMFAAGANRASNVILLESYIDFNRHPAGAVTVFLDGHVQAILTTVYACWTPEAD